MCTTIILSDVCKEILLGLFFGDFIASCKISNCCLSGRSCFFALSIFHMKMWLINLISKKLFALPSYLCIKKDQGKSNEMFNGLYVLLEINLGI